MKIFVEKDYYKTMLRERKEKILDFSYRKLCKREESEWVDTSNEETLAGLEEVKQMKADASMGKAYTDVDLMMKELLE